MQNKLFELIKAGDYEFDEVDWKDISEPAKDLIRRILVVDPAKRMTCADILAHPWVTGEVSDAPLPGTIGQLKIFNARRKLKAGFNAVRTAVRVRMLTGALREASGRVSATCMCVRVCVCACVRVCVCACVRVRACACVCVRAWFCWL